MRYDHQIFSLLRRAALCGVFMLLCSVAASAQFNAGLQGSVTDASGAVVAGATVSLTSNESGKAQQVTSSEDGFYRFSGLTPGRYTLTVEQSGFNKTVLENVVVSAEEIAGVDVALQTGGITETVTVTDTVAPLVETESANIRATITTEEVRQLPQVGRNPYELLRTAPGIFGDTARSGTGNQAALLPGVEGAGGSNTGVFQTENQTQISANGQRVSSNNYQVDGVSVNSLGQGGAAVLTPNQESIKEISVTSSTYSAEDGRNTGAQVKVVSQNGTNDFHGSAVFNYGSPGLNSFNKFFGSDLFPARPTRVETLERRYAGSLGGPIYLPRFGEGGPAYFSGRNKLFFFASYEGLRRANTNFADIFIETPEFRDYVSRVRPGSFAAQLYNYQGLQPRLVATGLSSATPAGPFQVVNGQYGRSFDIGSLNSPAGQNINSVVFDGIPDVSLARVALPSSVDGNQYNFRIDYNRGDSDQFAFSSFFTKLSTLSASSSGRPFEDITFNPFNSALTLTYVRIFSSTVLNEARINFTRFNANELNSIGDSDLLIPRLQVNGFGQAFNFGGAPSYGIDRGRPNNRTQNTYEARDTITFLRGNLVTKVGGEIRREQNNNNEVAGARPEFVFKSLLDFANDSVFFQNIDVDPRTGGPANGQRYFRSTTLGLFVQNDYKFRPNLTLNLGLRYEYQSPLTEKEGRLTNYEFGSNGVFNGRLVAVDRLYDPDTNNFAPRVGFAYSPRTDAFGGVFRDDRAVIRGGFGISYDRIFQNQLANARFNSPDFARVGLCCSGTNNAADLGPILYSFAIGGNPFLYPNNPALQRGIDPVSGGLREGTPQVLPGGFLRTAIPTEVNGVPRDLKNAYVYSYSLDFQYQLTRKIFSSVGYQGSLGRKLIRTVDLNRYYPGDTFGNNNRDRVQQFNQNGQAVAPRLTGNPNFDRIFFALPDVNSSYNALLVRLASDYSKNFRFDLNYRYAKSIDTSSFGRGAQQTDPSNQALERGPSDFDVRHNLSIQGLYRLPFFNNGEGALGKLLGGFEINGIFSYHTGLPFTPVVFGPENEDLNGDGFRPDRPTGYLGGAIQNPSNRDFLNGIFPGGGARYFTTARGAAGVGRNSFRGPDFRQIDLSIVKQTRLGFLGLGEQANLDLRANFFNVFNILNLSPFYPVTPNVDVGNGSFGRVTNGLAGRIVELQARFSF